MACSLRNNVHYETLAKTMLSLTLLCRFRSTTLRTRAATPRRYYGVHDLSEGEPSSCRSRRRSSMRRFPGRGSSAAPTTHEGSRSKSVALLGVCSGPCGHPRIELLPSRVNSPVTGWPSKSGRKPREELGDRVESSGPPRALSNRKIRWPRRRVRVLGGRRWRVSVVPRRA